MTALLAVYWADGERVRAVGTCNAHCYNGKPKEHCTEQGMRHCVCICRGKNHAAGLMAAVRNINEDRVGLRRHFLEHFAKVHHYDPATLTVIDRLKYQNRARANRAARRALFPAPVPVDDLFGKLLKLDQQGLRTAGVESDSRHPGGAEPVGGAAGRE